MFIIGTRLELQAKLEELLGSRNVYYQPPESLKLKYPCIMYESDVPQVTHADDLKYISHNRYQITYMDENPESTIPSKIAELPLTSWDSRYVSDSLYHTVFFIYY